MILYDVSKMYAEMCLMCNWHDDGSAIVKILEIVEFYQRISMENNECVLPPKSYTYEM